MEHKEKSHAQLVDELQSANERFDSLFEGAGDAILIVDARTFDIILVNDNTERRLGYSHNELLQLKLTDLEVVHTPDSIDNNEWVSSFSGTRVYECEYRHKDESLMPVEVSSRLTRYNQRVVFQIFVRDISQRKKMEAKQQQLISDLDAYNWIVAHNLKNPIFAIQRYLEIIGEELHKENSPNLKPAQYLQRTREITQQVSETIDHMLNLSSMHQDQSLGIKTIDMMALVYQVIELSEVQIEEANATISVNPLLPNCVGYSPWVAEVWMNYISNATKYGGQSPIIHIGGERDGDFIRYWVDDSGDYLPDETSSLLFNYSAPKNIHKNSGHGLGLIIVKHIVERWEGRVGNSRGIHGGNRFWFTIPV